MIRGLLHSVVLESEVVFLHWVELAFVGEEEIFVGSDQCGGINVISRMG